MLPVSERGEPEIPVEARLVGGVDAGAGVEVLRLVEEAIGGPVFAVVGALEFDLVTMRCHDGEEAVLVCYAEGLECDEGLEGEGCFAPEHLAYGDEGCVEDPGEDDGDDCGSERCEGSGFGFVVG